MVLAAIKMVDIIMRPVFVGTGLTRPSTMDLTDSDIDATSTLNFVTFKPRMRQMLSYNRQLCTLLVLFFEHVGTPVFLLPRIIETCTLLNYTFCIHFCNLGRLPESSIVSRLFPVLWYICIFHAAWVRWCILASVGGILKRITLNANSVRNSEMYI